MRRSIHLATLTLLATACGACSGLARGQAEAGQPTGALPYVAIGHPPPTDYPDIMLTAIVGGTLRIEHGCVLLESARGDRSLPVFHHGAEIGRDRRGVFVRDRTQGWLLRDGDRFVGGGGQLPYTATRPVFARGPLPDACRAPMVSINPGLRRD